MGIRHADQEELARLECKTLDARFLTVVTMNPKIRLFLVRNDGHPCGIVGLWRVDDLDRTAMTLILLGDRVHGRGDVMPEAGRQAARLAFDELGIQSLLAMVMMPNLPSRLVTNAIGFKPIGVWRNSADLDGKRVDRMMYDLTRKDLEEAEARAREGGAA